VIIVSKSGLNLTGPEIERYRVVLIPQHIRVDGIEHRTDEPPPFALVDRWARESNDPPEVVPFSEAELLPVLQAARAGLSLDRTAELTSSFAARATTVIVPRTLENLVRGGRANFLRAMVANLLGMSPVIGIVGGEMRPIDRVRRSESFSKILEVLGAKVGAGRKVWAAVAHGGNALEARALADRIEETFDAELMPVGPLTSGAYLHLGEDALACTVAPIDEVSWTPSRPPPQ
jgi:fatty acid-binding protein DegV